MKRALYILQLVVVLAMACGQHAMANDREKMLSNSVNYSVVPNGTGLYTIKVPVYVGSRLGNYWASGSCVIMVDVDGQSYELLNYKASNYDNEKTATNDVQVMVDRGNKNVGLFTFYNANNTSEEIKGYDGAWHKISRRMTTDLSGMDFHTTYLEFSWKGNPELFNKKSLKFRVEAGYSQRIGSDYMVKMDLASYQYNSTLVAPTIAGAYVNTDVIDGDEGQVKVIGFSPSTPDMVEIYVNDKFYKKKESVDNSSIEFVLDQCDTTRVVQIIGYYTEDKFQTSLKSNSYTVPPYHQIKDMKIRELHEEAPRLSEGHKEITWSLDPTTANDMFTSDHFIVERAFKPNMSDAIQVGYLAINDTISWGKYRVVDDTNNAAVNPEGGDKTYYRVRRATSIGLFSNVDNKYSVADSIVNMVAFLPKVSTVSRKYSEDFDSSHKIDVTIELDMVKYTKSENQPNADNRNYIAAKWMNDARLMLYINRTDYNYRQLGMDSVELDTRELVLDSIHGKYLYNKEYALVEPYCLYTFSSKVVIPETAQKYMHFADGGSKDDGQKSAYVYFQDMSPIRNIYATEGTEYGKVRLNWELPSNRIDQIIVMRRLRSDKYSKIENLAILDPTSTFYEDKTAELGVEYEYGLTTEAIYSGTKISKSSWNEIKYVPAYGWVSPVGKITGRVVTAQGIGLGGQAVNLTYGSTIVKEVTTRDDGTFVLDDITLQKEGRLYTVTIPSQQLEFTYNNVKAGAQVTIGAQNPLYDDLKFVCTTVERFSGRVLFENSTVPVSGAMFRIKGETVHGGNGLPIKTDNNGNFEFYVPKCEVSVQVYKPGHRFVNDGYILDKKTDQKEFTPDSKYDGLTLYDQTKVLLRGRIIGGNTLAAMPLGQGLTQNNLGDSITIQMKLEGNNTASIVYLTDHPEKDTLVVYNEQMWEGKVVTRTRGNFFRKQIDIHVDNATGEYAMELFPTKYKITQAFAQGYASLLANGEVSQILDLTNSVDEDSTKTATATHIITYHSDVDISYKQLAWGVAELPYLGEEKLTDRNLFEKDFSTTLAYVDNNDSVNYLLDAPLYLSGMKYFLRGTAHEDYYYNNVSTGAHYIEPIHHGVVRVQNGFASSDPQTEEYELDENGQFTLSFVANNDHFALSGEDALRQLNSSVLLNGYYYQSKALSAYVTGQRDKEGEMFTAKNADIVLLDVLRDPPGPGSFSYYGKGKQYEMSRSFSFSGEISLNIDLSTGTSYNSIVGALSGAPGILTGVSTSGNSGWQTSFKVPIVNVGYQHLGTYNFTSKDVIKTSENPEDVGAMADVYIGATSDMICITKQVITVIDDTTYNANKPSIDAGLIKVIQKGKNVDGKMRYLVTAEKLAPGLTLPSTFVYSQKHILTKVIPQLITERNSLPQFGIRIRKERAV